ncbi:MAG: hypothetical protein MUF64_07630 [Polyangiaceae bacterium]|nr:hypothetical protein [Polyangiaceae bacterium]
MPASLSTWIPRRLLAPLAATAALCAPASARAEPSIEGVIVALDGEDLVLDLGSLRGASEGAVVELWRPLTLRHPLTRKPLSDRFRIGTLKLKQVRPNLALASPEGEPLREPKAGDVVILRSPSPPSPPGTAPTEPKPPSPPAETPGDPEAEDLARMLVTLQGATPDLRAQRYEEFARRWPQGRASRALLEEAALLRARTTPAPAPPPREEYLFSPPPSALAGRPLHLALQLRDPRRRAVLHHRPSADATYTSRPMETVGAGYHVARLQPGELRSPEVLYFIEVIDGNGQVHPLLGSAAQPRRVQVKDPAAAGALGAGPVTASLWVDYANFNRLRSNDYLVQTEGFFSLRLGDTGLRAMRSGFGVLRGRGGTLRELDELGLQGRSVGLTYGYLEGEWASTSTLSFLGRLVLGLRRDGVGSGGQAFVRFGNDQRTNLLIGGEFLGGVGLRGITQLEWRTIPRVPILMRTEVTNQPAGEAGSQATPNGLVMNQPTEATGKGEVGLRAIVQAGYELSPALTLAARASYQGRTINHAGPGFGAAVTYQW